MMGIEIDLDDEEHLARVSTALLCSSMLALGVALGINLFAIATVIQLDLATFTDPDVGKLRSYQRIGEWTSLIVFAVTSVAYVAIHEKVAREES